MKNMICGLAWKLETIMFFYHFIFIIKMIVICFQIWILIKFKFQKKNKIVWDFIFHTYYKYRSQCIRKTLQEKKKHKKKIHKKEGANPKESPSLRPTTAPAFFFFNLSENQQIPIPASTLSLSISPPPAPRKEKSAPSFCPGNPSFGWTLLHAVNLSSLVLISSR